MTTNIIATRTNNRISVGLPDGTTKTLSGARAARAAVVVVAHWTGDGQFGELGSEWVRFSCRETIEAGHAYRRTLEKDTHGASRGSFSQLPTDWCEVVIVIDK